MQISLGGEADVEELFSERWQIWCRKLTNPAKRVYEFLVTQYSDGIEEIDIQVLAKHTGTSKNALTKSGGIFEQLENFGLVNRAEIE
jgi:hypothetical protein